MARTQRLTTGHSIQRIPSNNPSRLHTTHATGNRSSTPHRSRTIRTMGGSTSNWQWYSDSRTTNPSVDVNGQPNGYYDNGRWVSGAAQGYYDRNGRWMRGEAPGRRDSNGVWVADPLMGAP